MNTTQARQSIESCLKMKAQDRREYWLMKMWHERKHKQSKRSKNLCFTFY
jgi:hypothetical protein